MSSKILQRKDLSLEIEKVLSSLNVAPNAPVKLDVSGDSLTVSIVQNQPISPEIEKALDKTNARYGVALQNLA